MLLNILHCTTQHLIPQPTKQKLSGRNCNNVCPRAPSISLGTRPGAGKELKRGGEARSPRLSQNIAAKQNVRACECALPGHSGGRILLRLRLGETRDQRVCACAPGWLAPTPVCRPGECACACRHFLTPGAQAAQPAGKCDLLLGKMAVCGETGLGGISPEVVPATAARWR